MNKSIGKERRSRARRPQADREKPIEELSRLEVIERDNRILSDAVDSLRDLTTEQGRRLSELAARLERFEIQSQIIAQPDPPLMTGSASRATGPIDPPGPIWGA